MSEQIQGSANTDFRIEIPTKSREGARYVIFVGDTIDPIAKSHNPDWRIGGKISPIAALKYRQGYIARCEIVELRQSMVPELASMVHPEQRAHRIPAYTIIENGETRAVGGDGLLRTAFYPSDQIDRLTGQVDGVVEVPVANGAEMYAAQRFLFPNWDNIVAGVEQLPIKIAALRQHLQARLAVARELGNALFTNVAQAALRSCDEYTTWGNVLIASQNAMYETAKTKGWAWSYGSDASLAFELLGLQRRDGLAQEQANRMDELIAAQIKQAEMMGLVLGQAMGAGQTAPAPTAPVEVFPAESAVPIEEQEIVVAEEEEVQADVPEEIEPPQEKPDPQYVIGALVAFPDETIAEIRGTKFGKLQVQFPDGTTKQVDKKDVQLIAA